MSSIHLKAKATTDYWRKPPSVDVSNAPTHNLVSFSSSQNFQSARVTVSASWTRLYDQGGLLILLPSAPGEKQRWVKAGIEFAGGRTNLSVVAANQWADWSLHALDGDSATIQFEREPQDVAKGKGSVLFVYLVRNGVREELPVREVTWAFEHQGETEVKLYAARPTKKDGEDEEELTVKFDDISTN